MTTPIEKFLEKYQNRMPFEYINFKPKEPIDVLWWGIQRIAIIDDINTGEPKEVVQLLVRDISDGKYKIITTTSFSLLSQLAKIQKKFTGHDEVAHLKITQFKENTPAGKFKTYYKVNYEIENIPLPESAKETEKVFLYGETNGRRKIKN
jgi:hypothetical protein